MTMNEKKCEQKAIIFDLISREGESFNIHLLGELSKHVHLTGSRYIEIECIYLRHTEKKLHTYTCTGTN